MGVKINDINSPSGTPLFLFSFTGFLPGSLVSRSLSPDKVGGESSSSSSTLFQAERINTVNRTSRRFIHSLQPVVCLGATPPRTSTFSPHTVARSARHSSFRCVNQNSAGTNRKKTQIPELATTPIIVHMTARGHVCHKQVDASPPFRTLSNEISK